MLSKNAWQPCPVFENKLERIVENLINHSLRDNQISISYIPDDTMQISKNYVINYSLISRNHVIINRSFQGNCPDSEILELNEKISNILEDMQIHIIAEKKSMIGKKIKLNIIKDLKELIQRPIVQYKLLTLSKAKSFNVI